MVAVSGVFNGNTSPLNRNARWPVLSKWDSVTSRKTPCWATITPPPKNCPDDSSNTASNVVLAANCWKLANARPRIEKPSASCWETDWACASGAAKQPQRTQRTPRKFFSFLGDLVGLGGSTMNPPKFVIALTPGPAAYFAPLSSRTRTPDRGRYRQGPSQ